MRLSDAAKLLGARLLGEDAEILSVATDSRSIKGGELFFALRGEHFDGHEFVTSALQQGACGAVVDQQFSDDALAENSSRIKVADTTLALGLLANAWRKRFKIPLIAITGSNGKTTVKQMIAAILSAHAGSERVHASQGNLNNHVGLPLSLLTLRDQHQYSVVEMGMNHFGEIGYLAGLAKPDVAVITNAAAAHLEGLGSVENVARAKAEIFQSLNVSGVAVINADDNFSSLWRGIAGTVHCMTFGLEKAADVQGKLLQSNELEIEYKNESIRVRLKVPGKHNLMNALAATAATIAAGVGLPSVMQGLKECDMADGRLQFKQGLNGVTLIDDSYNANPESVRAALDVLMQQPGERVFVFGDMRELGENEQALHNECIAYAKHIGVEKILTLGTFSNRAANGLDKTVESFGGIDELVKTAQALCAEETVILIKGSRAMRMERVVQALALSHKFTEVQV